MNPKDLFRNEIGKKRDQLDSEWTEKASRHLIDRFQILEEFQSSEIIALYKAISAEVNLEALFPACWKMVRGLLLGNPWLLRSFG